MGNLILAVLNFIVLVIPNPPGDKWWTGFAINVVLLLVGLHYFARYLAGRSR